MGLILGLVAFAFISALTGGAVYDDQMQLLRNPTLQDAGNIPKMFTQGVWEFSNETSARSAGTFYRPIFNIGLILNYHLFGLHLVGWHLFSLLVHLLATLLVYLLARQWGLSIWTAGITTLLFGLHSVHVESVAWISAFPDPLVAVFILSSILLYERYYQSKSAPWYLIAASILFALAAMFTKEIGVVLPVFLAFGEWIQRSKKESKAALARRVCQRIAPFAAAALVYLVARHSVLGFISQNDPRAAGIGSMAALLTIPSIVLGYLRLLVFPLPLAFVYDNEYVKSAADVRFWGACIALVVIMGLVPRSVRSSRVAQHALSLLVLFILPVLNIRAFNPYESLLHDRYLYLPSAGFCILTAMGATWLGSRAGKNQRRILTAVGSIVFVLLFCLTWIQNRTWKSDLNLTEHAARWYPKQAFALNQLGLAYAQENRWPEAEQSLRKAVSLHPESYGFQFDLGYFYAQEKRYDEAVQSYQKAIALGINSPFAFFNLGVAYLGQGNLVDAEKALRQAVGLLPGFAEALFNIGWIDEQQGKLDAAEKTYLEAVRRKPSYADSYIGLARIYGAQGRYQEAADQLQTILEDDPENAAALFEFGGLYMRTNHCREAISFYEQLAKLEPRYPGGLTFLGLSYECAGDIERAKASYRQAIQLVPEAPNTHVAREHLERLESH